MAIQECENGHIFDNVLHKSCPYCVKIDRIDFGESDDTGKTVASSGNVNSDIGKTVASTASMNSGIEVTVAATGAGNSDVGVTVAATGVGNSDVGVTVAATGTEKIDVGAAEAVMSLDNSDIGVTVAPSSYHNPSDSSDSGKTVGIYRKATGFNPVVGWLVCIEGTQKGKDYRIYDGVNTIGRDERMDICLRGDISISRENHAKLGYDKKHNSFHIIPVEGAETIYLNDEPVYVPMVLKNNDIIEIGVFKLRFISFCDESFVWDYDKKDGNK